MNPRRVLTPADAGPIFDRAVAERALAVLTLPQGPAWATLKSRFLERDRQGRYFVLDYQALEGDALPPIAPGQCVGVSFRHSSRKILFGSVVEAKGHFVVDDRNSVAAIRYRWPDTLTELQRRAYYRTLIPAEMGLRASLWLGGAAARPTSPNGSRVLTGDLADISCGGALVQMHQAVPPDCAIDDLLGVELNLPDNRPPIVVDMRYRGSRQDPTGLLAVAVQFLGLEITNEGRAILGRLAGCVQRLHRLSATGARGT
jgi:c-di-GMP-binding flagellar brake protein YcgR